MCDAGRESWFWVRYESLKLLLNLKIYYTIACVNINEKQHLPVGGHVPLTLR